MQRLFARRLRVCTISPSAREASLCTRVFFAPCRRLREALESSAELACTYPFTLTMYTTRPGRAHTTGVDAPDDIPPPFRSTVYRRFVARYMQIPDEIEFWTFRLLPPILCIVRLACRGAVRGVRRSRWTVVRGCSERGGRLLPPFSGPHGDADGDAHACGRFALVWSLVS